MSIAASSVQCTPDRESGHVCRLVQSPIRCRADSDPSARISESPAPNVNQDEFFILKAKTLFFSPAIFLSFFLNETLKAQPCKLENLI